jgi:antitoxin (DNA-binding transcriptional repressor) of toxin-antitoxin stability system
MFYMKEASTRFVRQHFNRDLERVADGEKVGITKWRRSVARSVPVSRQKAAPRRVPDVTARLQKVFGRKIISERDMAKILDENRSAF